MTFRKVLQAGYRLKKMGLCTKVSQFSENQARGWLEKKHKNIAPGRKGFSPFTPWARNTYILNFKQFFAWCADKKWCATLDFPVGKRPKARVKAPLAPPIGAVL
jgi:hypothetical protein